MARRPVNLVAWLLAALLAVGVAAGGCSTDHVRSAAIGPGGEVGPGGVGGSGAPPVLPSTPTVPSALPSGPVPPNVLPPIPPPHPGGAVVADSVPVRDGALAITVDDGFCPECVGGYVTLAEHGLHVTICPNGMYQSVWRPYVARIRVLLAQGKVQMCNHTYSHDDLRTLSDAAIADEIDRNEDWIEHTFGVTTRPYLRPPYGSHDQRTDRVAASLGFTSILLWNGSFGDSGLLDAPTLLGEASKYLRPGTVMLCHANYPTAVRNFAKIQALIDQRGLHPLTLDEAFGTSRSTGLSAPGSDTFANTLADTPWRSPRADAWTPLRSSRQPAWPWRGAGRPDRPAPTGRSTGRASRPGVR